MSQELKGSIKMLSCQVENSNKELERIKNNQVKNFGWKIIIIRIPWMTSITYLRGCRRIGCYYSVWRTERKEIVKAKQRIRDLWRSIKIANIHIMRVPGKDERNKRTEKNAWSNKGQNLLNLILKNVSIYSCKINKLQVGYGQSSAYRSVS